MQRIRYGVIMVALALAAFASLTASAQQPQPRPNIVVIWGDDIGIWNISYNSRGMMGYQTPNIDHIAKEGIAFTDYYGQQSCTAGRAAFMGGSVPVRTGMTKVGLPGAKEGWQKSDLTIAALLKAQGYATGQFGKNHFGDRDEHLPTMHGFDEFFGNLYHLNAEEEPENRRLPEKSRIQEEVRAARRIEDQSRRQRRPDRRGHRSAHQEAHGNGRRRDIGCSALDFIDRQHKEGKPFFVWWNGTRMHFRTHVKAENRGISGQDEYGDGMVEHDRHVGALLKNLDDLGIANNTIVFYSTDNGPHFNTSPNAGTTPFRSEKNSNWEGAYRVPAFARWPGNWQAGVTFNGIVAHGRCRPSSPLPACPT